MRYFLFFSIILISGLLSCNPGKKVANISRHREWSLKFLQEYIIPPRTELKGTVAGGLSSIDYDSSGKCYYAICDDRSEINPARFYTLKIEMSDGLIDTILFTDVATLLLPDGNPFAARTTDPEAMRYNPLKDEFIWSSEGERNRVAEINPTLRIMNRQGQYKDSFDLPANMKIISGKGPRQNGVWEGMTFLRNYEQLVISLEEPLLEDGPRAAGGDSAAWVRFIVFDVKSRRQLAQYAYKADPVAHPANPPGAYKVNGISDILALNDQEMLVIERSFSTGKNSCTVRVYLTSLDGAIDVSDVSGLHEAKKVVPMRKKLLLDMDDLHRHIDNIEGVTPGPVLPNGNASLIFIADDNFSPTQKNQVLLFELLR